MTEVQNRGRLEASASNQQPEAPAFLGRLCAKSKQWRLGVRSTSLRQQTSDTEIREYQENIPDTQSGWGWMPPPSEAMSDVRPPRGWMKIEDSRRGVVEEG